MSAPRTLGVLTVAAALVAGVSACGSGFIGAATQDVGSNLDAAMAQVEAAGKPAYYTNDLVTDVRGLHCRRLEPQLGVPAGVVMGELTLVTGHLVVTVSDFRGRDGSDTDITHAVRLLPHLQAVGASSPVGTLPPPDASGVAWVDKLCGTNPGQEVSHDFDGKPTG